MEAYGLEAQVVLTTPLLLSWDGAKMSSSVGNNIPLTAPPEEQFGRTMRIPDEMLPDWWRLVAERDAPDGDPMEAKLDFADVLRLTRTTTVAQILERDDFAQRMGANEPISVSELLYPLMQAYDSVAVEADVELGGTDQLYNLLAGRTVMEAYGLEAQVVLTTPLLLSWDGAKMSSSVGNNIPLTAPPEEQFGRTMRIPDDMLAEWWQLVAEQPVPAGEPMEAKLELARLIVRRSHGEDAVQDAEAHFTRVVREHAAPDDVPEHLLPAGDPVHLPAVIADAFGLSTSDARRMIGQGGVKLDGAPVEGLDVARAEADGKLLQAGKRRFARLVS